jgi:hypothetical protein
MEMMTDEEAEALDEYYTKNTPEIDPSRGNFHPDRMVVVDDFTANYIPNVSMYKRQTPTEVVRDLVHQKLLWEASQP